MSKEIDRSAPEWPRYKADGITADGFGEEEGNQPCFCTKHNSCRIYLPHKITKHHPTAKMIFSRIMPTIDKIWPDCGDRTVKADINGEKWNIFLYFAFTHILIRRL